MRNLWQNYLTSGRDPDQLETAVLNQIKFVNLFSTVGVSALLTFGCVYLFKGIIFVGIFELFSGILGIINILVLRKTGNAEFAGTIILVFMIAVLNMLLISGGIQKTGIFWFFTFPFLAFFLKGMRNGSYYLLSLIFVSMIALFLHKIEILPQFPYSLIEFRQLLLSLFAVSLLVYFYEKVRVESEKTIKMHEKEILIKNIFDQQFMQAGEIQRNFIPQKNLILPEIEIAGFYQPAMEIGGDYMDFFYLDPERISVIIADVSGKGIPAALIMIKLRTLVHSHEILKKLSASEAISFLNRFFKNDPNSDMFITMIYLVINIKTGAIDFSNAGQGPITYFSKKDAKISTVDCYGMPIGISESTDRFDSCQLKLFPGDIITLFTDGISEATNNKGDKYGKELLYARIMESKDLPAEIISKKIMNEILKNTEPGRQKDDITLVVIKKK